MTSITDAIPSFGAATLEGFDTASAQIGERLPGLKRQYVRFYSKTESEVYATEVVVNEKTGSTKVVKTAVRPVTREMVHIVTPGDTNNVVDDHAADFHKREHWREYKAFRDGKTAPLGKDIDECTSYISSPVATELRYLGVHTEEQLADASDLLCGRIANGFDLREFARSSCQARNTSKDQGAVLALKTQLEDSQKMIAELQKQMAKISSGALLDSKGNAIAVFDPEEITVEKRKGK